MEENKLIQENEIRNQQILNQFYNNINNHFLFESAILNLDNDEFYYENVINNHIKYRIDQLLSSEDLKSKIGLLKPFNNQIKLILVQIVVLYSKVVKWKSTNNHFHESNLRVIFNRNILYLENEFIRSIEENFLYNPILAFRLNEYCIGSLKSMISFLKSNLLINFDESPLSPRFQSLISKYEGLSDVEKMKVFASQESKNFIDKKLPRSKSENNDHPFTFKNNFDDVKEDIIITYFRTSLVDKKHISESVLNEFLSLAFDEEIIPEQKFTFEKIQSKEKIVRIFYDYYREKAGSPYGRQSKYFDLLKKYFTGFEKINIRNFSK